MIQQLLAIAGLCAFGLISFALTIFVIVAGTALADGHDYLMSLNLRKRRQRRVARPERQTPQMEDYSMSKKRFTLVAVVAIGMASITLLPGCGTLGISDKDGVPVEIDVIYQDNFGNEYQLASGPDGINLYVSAKGDLYEISDTGFAITAPDGQGGKTTVRVQRVEDPPAAEVAPNPDSEAALRRVHEAVG